MARWLATLGLLSSGVLASDVGAQEEWDASTEPVAMGIPLRAGATLESVLAALNARGHRIVYSSALVLPTMTLREVPKTASIAELLREILTPWNLRAVHAANGDWLIVSQAVPATTVEVSIVEDHFASIETIDVTASRTRLATAGVSETFLDREDVQRMPHLADDAVRMLKVLPGVTGGDFSAALNIRGGRREEALLTVDGAEIHNGFHFRDIDGALSVLDTNLVEGIDFITGGMTAEYGDYMSGVVGLQSRRPSPDDEYRSGIGISFVSAYGRTSGTFAADRGSWLVSARRGFLDVLTERLVEEDETLTPRYSDVFGAANYELGERSSLAARVLLSDDDLKFADDDGDNIDSAGTGRSAHLWFEFDHGWTDVLQMNTLVAIATVNQKRDASGADDQRSSTIRSDNDFRFLDLKQDWSWRLGDHHLPRWGFNVNRQDGDYDYALVSRITDPLVAPVPIDIAYATDMDVRVNKFGAYASWRSRVTDSVTAEAGLRWDSYEYPDRLKFDVVSPRLNFVYDFGQVNEWRAAWGVVYQPQAANELQVEDNVTQFFEPERSEQFVIGYTRRFERGLSLRVDVYEKKYSDLRARFENLLDPIQLIPEGSADRIRIDAPEARARGVELTMRREAERGLSGWVSLSIAQARENVEGDWQSRSWEQEQTLAFGSSWTGTKWNVSLAGLFHSGTPTTYIGVVTSPTPGGGIGVEGVVGERNADHMAPYARIDLRANRDVQLRNSQLSLYVEVTNLFNIKNECCVESYRVQQNANGLIFLDTETSYWLPMLPSFGIQWEF
jgi:hypothetical protein